VWVFDKHVNEVLTCQVAGLGSGKEKGQTLVDDQLVVVLCGIVFQENLKEITFVSEIWVHLAVASAAFNNSGYLSTDFTAVCKDLTLIGQNESRSEKGKQACVRGCHSL